MAESLMNSIQLKRFELVDKFNEAQARMMAAKQEADYLKRQIAELDSLIIASTYKSTTQEITTTTNTS